MRTVVIDDQKQPRGALTELLKLYCPQITVVAQAHNVSSGLIAIKKNLPELVFLDIEMPDGTGFDLLQKLDNINFKVIFTTGYEKYAIKAFKFSAIDYLLKPVDSDDLLAAVNKATKEPKREIVDAKIQTLLGNFYQNKELPQKIVLSDSDSLHVIETKDIIRLESQDNYTNFYLKNDKTILISKHLKTYEMLLSHSGFYRTHQSHMVNLNEIKRLDKKNGGLLIMSNNATVPISRRKKEELINTLYNLK